MTIPIVTARALKIINAHPAVEDIRILDHFDDGTVVVEIDIANELPAAWRPAGESPSGVRSVETVRLGFPANYPAFPPNLALRADFNRSHPHINPGRPNKPPEPCLIAGSPRELIQSRGIDGLIDQLVDWLDKAAMFTLNDPAIGWEPVRRDHIDDLMIVDGDKMRAFANPDGGCVAVPTTFFQLGDTTQKHFAIDHRSNSTVEIGNVQCQRELFRPNIWRGHSIGLVAWAPDVSPGQPFVAGHYFPETVATVSDLRSRAAEYGCNAQLDPKLNHLGLLADQGKLPAVPVAITLLARRPYNIIGTTSPIELCSYLIDLSALRDIKN